MAETRRDELRRERLREYEAALAAARSPIEVLVLFAKARENRASGERLEESFAASTTEGVDEADLLPAAVWVALRQGDVDAAVQALVQKSSTDFVLAAHEQLDARYRLTTVEERRALPDVGRLDAQVASFLRIPRDVVTMVVGWGADDPRTAAEVETLVEQRFGATLLPGKPAATGREPMLGTTADRPRAKPSANPSTSSANVPSSSANPSASSANLSMSSTEFAALLNLTPEQQAVLATLVRQSTITIGSDL